MTTRRSFIKGIGLSAIGLSTLGILADQGVGYRFYRTTYEGNSVNFAHGDTFPAKPEAEKAMVEDYLTTMETYNVPHSSWASTEGDGWIELHARKWNEAKQKYDKKRFVWTLGEVKETRNG